MEDVLLRQFIWLFEVPRWSFCPQGCTRWHHCPYLLKLQARAENSRTMRQLFDTFWKGKFAFYCRAWTMCNWTDYTYCIVAASKERKTLLCCYRPFFQTTYLFQYNCSICAIFDDECKGQYHCEACGLCRIGGQENFFHCATCDMCLPKNLENEHKVIIIKGSFFDSFNYV